MVQKGHIGKCLGRWGGWGVKKGEGVAIHIKYSPIAGKCLGVDSRAWVVLGLGVRCWVGVGLNAGGTGLIGADQVLPFRGL